MGGFFGGGGGSTLGPVYAAKFSKNWFDISGSYINTVDGITEIQSSTDVSYDTSQAGLPLWHLQTGMYLCNVKMQYEAAGGTGTRNVGVNECEATCLVQIFPNGSNVGHRYIWQTQYIPDVQSQLQAAICAFGLIFITDTATQGLFLASDWNWGQSGGVNIGLNGFILFKKLSDEQVTLVD